MPLSSPPRRPHLARTVSLLGVTAACAIALTFGQSAVAAEFAATASVSPRVQYLGDSVGTTFTVTVENTGTTDSIGAVEVGRPSRAWTITECPSAPAGWAAQRSDTMCRYRSSTGTGDNIAPGMSSSAFQVRATVIPGAQNIVGSWSVKVSKSDTFDKRSKLVAAASEPFAVDLTAYSFEVLDAVVDPATTTPGAACPAPNKSAVSATGGHTVVICGRNRTTGTSTPTAAQSTLGGSFVGSPGSFSSAPVDPTPTSVILGSWTNVTTTSTSGTGKSVVAVIGSAANRTSPETTLGGYEALAASPDAVDDVADVGEDANGTAIDVLANDTDTENDTLTVTAVDTTGTTGQVTNNGTDVTYDPNGQFENLAAGETATDTFTYTVTDGTDTDTATVTITINGANDPPNANDDTDLVGEDSTGAAIIVLANDTDPDAGDTLTVTAVDTTGTTGQVTNNGTDVTYDPNGQFENLAAGETATDTFTYTVSDGNGGTDTATVTITINGANDPPNAADDTKTVSKDSAGDTIDVLANDSDPDTTDALTINTVDTTGTAGSVTITNAGADVTYDPNGQFDSLGPEDTATDTFTYSVSDGNGGTDTATVTITVTGVNAPPVAVADTKTVGEDSTGATVDVLANDTDFNNDTLTVTAVDTTGTAGQVTNNGTDVTYDPNGQFENLAVGQTATDTFTYTVTDGTDTDTATVTVTITGANDPPNANDDADDVGENSSGATIDVLANDTDADAGDTLTVTAVDTTGTTGQVTNNGTNVTYDPNGQFENVAAGETATDTFTYTVSDGNGGTDIATVTITINGVNDPPAAVDDTGTTDEDTTLNQTAPGVLANDTDPDFGEVLSVVELNGSSTLTGTSTDGATVTINADGSYSYDPGSIYQGLSTGQSDTDTFAYTVSDSTGATDTATVTVTINGVSDAPTAVADSFDAIGNTGLFVGTTKPAGQAGKVITGSVLTNDTDPDTAHASLVVEPVTDAATTLGGTITIESDGNFTYHPDDGDVATTDTFTYRVCDASPCNSGTVANATGTLSLPLTGQVWYVKNNQAAGGDGTSDTPFDTLLEAETASGTGDTTFVYDGDNTSTGLASGYQMDANERLIGEVSGLALDPDGGGSLPSSPLYPAAAGVTPTLTTTSAEDVVYLAAGTVVDGFVIDPGSLGGGIGGGTAAGAPGAAGNVTIANVHVNDTSTSGTGVQPGLELNGTTGTNNVSNLEVDNGGSATAIGVRLNSAGTVNFASTGTISVATSGAKALDAVSTSFGTSVFDDITVTGSGSGGVNLDTTTGTVTLGDGLGSDVLLTTTSGASPALRANNASNVTVDAAGTDELHATGGPAFSITGPGGVYAFEDVDSSNSSASGMLYENVGAGTLDIEAGTISGYAQWGFAHSGGTGNVDMGADIADGVGNNVSVINRTGGTVTFTGAITDSGDANGGAWATGNSNTTVLYEGGITLSTGASDAFAAINTGTVVVTDANGPGVAPDNTVTSTTGRGVVITGTTIGSDGVTFRSISSNGATNGLVLGNTGTTGGLTVTGNGGACATTGDACTGGTIQSTSGDAISLTSTRGVLLNRMKVVNNLGNGIRGSSVTNFAIRDSVVDNNGDDAATDEAGVHFTNLLGTSDITRTLVANSPEDNARIVNSSGTLTQLDVTDSTFRDTDTVSPGNNGLLIQADGGSITADVLGSTFLRNRANGLQAVTNGTGSLNIEIDDSGTTQSSFDDNNIGVSVAHNSSGTFSFGVRDLTIDGLNVAPGTGGSASPINVNLAGAATTTMTGSVTGNTLTNSHSTTGPGIRLIGNGTATMTVLVDGNNISQVANRGIETIARDGSNRINATITNNSVTLSNALAGDAIRMDSGAVSTDTTTICADIRGNTATTSAVGLFGIKVRQRFAGTSFILEDYAGAATNDAAVQSFLSVNNNAATTSADHGGAGFTTIADCPAP